MLPVFEFNADDCTVHCLESRHFRITVDDNTPFFHVYTKRIVDRRRPLGLREYASIRLKFGRHAVCMEKVECLADAKLGKRRKKELSFPLEFFKEFSDAQFVVGDIRSSAALE